MTEVHLGVDDTLFSGPAVSPDWKASDVAAGYVAAVSPVGVEIAKTKPDEEYPPRYPDPALHATAELARPAGPGRHHRGRRPDPDHGAAGRARARQGGVGHRRRDRALHAARLGQHHRRGAGPARRRRTRAAGQLPGRRRLRCWPRSPTTAWTWPGRGSTTAAVCRRCRASRRGRWSTPCASPPSRAARSCSRCSTTCRWAAGSARWRTATPPARVRAWCGRRRAACPGVTSLAGTVQTVDGRLLAFAVMADETPPGGQRVRAPRSTRSCSGWPAAGAPEAAA